MTSANFDYSQTSGAAEIRLRLELLANRLNANLVDLASPSVLEIGIGTGDCTVMLARRFANVSAIDSDPKVCHRVLKRLRSEKLAAPRMIISAVEDCQFDTCYHAILIQNILEHIRDPVSLLMRLRSILAPSGRLYVNVPLANSLHRHMGVELGIISSPDELAESDFQYGHYRVYTAERLLEHINAAGFRAVYEMPYYLKPFSTAMLRHLTDTQHAALFRLGQKFPELASYFYAEAIQP